MSYFKKSFLHAVTVLGHLVKLKTGLGLAFGAYLLHNFFMKMFLIQYSINGQHFNVTPYLLFKISDEMCY